MRDEINKKIVQRLIGEFSMKPVGAHLREGKCPDCHKKSLWTWAESPGVVFCDRKSKCGYEITTKDLFPDLFEQLNKTHAPTKEDPTKTAKAYLSLIRGFNLEKIDGWYTQGNYWHPNADKGTATVRFDLTDDGQVFWERFVDPVTITDPDNNEKTVRKSRASGSFKGMWWQPPGFVLKERDKVFLCEGILDALSLIECGFKAVAIMSSGTFPDDAIKPHLGKKITWVLALDNDIAGRKAIKKHAQKLADLGQTVQCALSSESDDKSDWNDLLIRKRINPAHMDDYLYYGALQLADSPQAKARIMWKRNTERLYFVFIFGNQMFSFKLNSDEYTKALSRKREEFGIEAPTGVHDIEKQRRKDEHLRDAAKEAFDAVADIREIATFRMEFHYFQQPANGEDGQYFLQLHFNNGAPAFFVAVNGEVFGEAKRFKKAMQTKAPGALFTGTSPDLDYIYRNWFRLTPKIVKTLDFVGYDADSGAYVFPEYAVEGDKIITLNPQNFFSLKRTGMKTQADIQQRLSINPPIDFLDDYALAFGVNGMIALSWWLGCLLAEQIRHKHTSYPFLQLIGEPASGKSALIAFLWKLIGKTDDTFNPNNSSLAGRYRKWSEVSNLPVVFNEVDNENDGHVHVKKFMWDEIKDMFEGRLGRVTGTKTQDNATRKPLFKGGVVAVQNVAVNASEAVRSRFVYLPFDRSHHSLSGKHAADRLRDIETETVSGFLLTVCRKTQPILADYNKHYAIYQRYLAANPKLNMQRIIQNHAQMMALTSCLKHIVPISDQLIKTTKEAIVERAVSWQAAMYEDHPIVQQFWFAVEYLNARGSDSGMVTEEHLINHSNSPETEIAINLMHFFQECALAKIETVSSQELRQYLPSSRRYKFIRQAQIRSRILHRNLRCFIFKAA